jgi:heme exporter protein B
MLYFYSIAGPVDFILSKLLFNALLMLVMSLLSTILFSLFLTYPVQKTAAFIGLVFLGGWSLSLVFTFLAAVAAKAQQNAAIMAILGFPILIPQLLLLMQVSSTVFKASNVIPLANVLLLLASNGLVVLLAVILFPFLWKD